MANSRSRVILVYFKWQRPTAVRKSPHKGRLLEETLKILSPVVRLIERIGTFGLYSADLEMYF